MKDDARILIAAGGTAGHVNPALAIANYILSEKPSAVVQFVGRSDGMERRLVMGAGFPFVSIEVHGFQRKPSLNNLKRNINAAYLLARSMPRAKKILTEFKPDLVIGTGGYICGPIMKVAQRMGIRTAIHESNSYPGVTNKLLAKGADIVFAVNERAKEALGVPDKTVITGNPVRVEILLADRMECRAKHGIDRNTLVILSLGGSLGASAINRAVAGFMNEMSEKGSGYMHYHSTGRISSGEFADLAREYNLKRNPRLHISEYIDNMPQMLAVADIVICRAGSMTMAELAAAGRAAVLIPSPNVAENHQYHNAMSMVEAGAAVLIPEKDLTPKCLMETIESLTPEKIIDMSIKAKTLHVADSLERIYQQLCNSEE